MRAFATHVRFALRTMRRAPAFTAVAVLCLAVGIGAITTMGEVTDLLLFRPPPHVRAPHELVQLHFDLVVPGARARQNVPGFVGFSGGRYADYLSLRDSVHVFSAVAAYSTDKLSLGRGAAARPVTAAFVTGTFFPLLGVHAALGHLISDDGVEANSSALPAVISYALWQTRFGADPAILGRAITVGKGTYVVAGVTPKGFRGVELLHPMDVWLPIGAVPQEHFPKRPGTLATSQWRVQLLGRMLPDMSPQLVTTRAAAMREAAPIVRLNRARFHARLVATLTPIIPGLGGERTKDVSVALWLTGVGAIVLLIACANVAGLLLVRAADRRREVAIRLSLGATRGQLAQLFLVEGMMLAVAGGVLGVVLRAWGGAAIRVFLLPRLDVPYGVFDLRLLTISALVTVVTGLACGLAPALHTWRRDIAGAVVGAPRDGRRRRPHVRAALLAGQVALALTLVAGAALFVASLRNVHAIQLGFTPDHVLVAQMPLPAMGYSQTEQRALYDRMLERVRALPGVRSASLSSHLPFVSWMGNPVTAPGADSAVIAHASRHPLGPELNIVSPTFFTTTGIALRSGRAFSDADRAGTEPVAIINETMARTVWPDGDALGQCIQIRQIWGSSGGETPCSRIVGIAADTKTMSIRDTPDLQVYALLSQRDDYPPAELLVRTAGDPAAIAASVRSAMQSTASGLPFADVQPWGAYLEPELRPWQLGASMFTLFGSIALALAAVGLYGVFSYAVARRTREMGVRAALGARAGDLLRMVMLDGLRLSGMGVVIGVLLALGLGRVLAALLVGVTGTSPTLLGAAVAIVLCVTLLAVVLPARRAARIDPAVALRDE